MAQITLGDLKQNPELLYQFSKENTRPMIQYCVRKFTNVEDAEDLVQDALVELIKMVKYQEIENPNAPAINWVYQRLSWRRIDLGRQEGRKISGEEGEKIISILPYPDSNIEEETIRKERGKFLRECIETRMKGRRREIFELYLEGYTAAEIARKLDVTKPYITKETKIGCRLLRQWLEQRGFD
jgi:RNA polymerase sigma factor (sigma-70 family)